MKFLTACFILFISLISNSQEFSENVYFDVDKFVLTNEAKETLSELILEIQNKNLEIVGYTDSTGGLNYNLALSKKRAQTVSDYLISKGINGKNLKPLQGRGETTASQGLDQNRKVTIKVFNEKIIESNDEREHLSKTKDAKLNQETIEKIKEGDILNIGGLEFHPGRHHLKDYSYPALNELTTILLDNPDLKIEIQGHICCQPSGDGLDTDTGTRNLSENRAESIYNDLIKRGVSRDRLTYKGFGANRKLEEEVNADAMQRNRRVSILILEK